MFSIKFNENGRSSDGQVGAALQVQQKLYWKCLDIVCFALSLFVGSNMLGAGSELVFY